MLNESASLLPDAAALLTEVRRRQPLVHHLTNWVTIAECAGITAAFGAAPVMAHAVEEAADMAALADALVLNIGTLDRALVDAMKLAARAANRKGIPVVLDVCGAGATPFRNQACRELLDAARIDIIKGNASEIASVAGLAVQTRGVNSGQVNDDLKVLARRLAALQHATVVITGKIDLVAGVDDTLFLTDNGHPLMSGCVGTGCMATSAIGVFAAVSPANLPAAAAAGLACYEIAAEIAAADAQGAIDFKNRLLDAVHRLSPAQLAGRVRISRA